MALWIILGVVGILILLVVTFIVSNYNNLIRAKNNVEESFSAMDVSMKKRYDLIPNVVNTVKGYAKHEKETLDAVIKARNSAMNAGSIEAKANAENELSGTLKTLFALTESYPDLKANTNFTNLQDELSNIETEIASSRRYYNACVKELNNKIELFPSNIIAKWFKFEKATMFNIEDPIERKNVKVEF